MLSTVSASYKHKHLLEGQIKHFRHPCMGNIVVILWNKMYFQQIQLKKKNPIHDAGRCFFHYVKHKESHGRFHWQIILQLLRAHEFWQNRNCALSQRRLWCTFFSHIGHISSFPLTATVYGIWEELNLFGARDSFTYSQDAAVVQYITAPP